MRTFSFSDQSYLSDGALNKRFQIFIPQLSEDLNFDTPRSDSVSSAVSIFRFFQVRSDELTPFFGSNNAEQNVDVYVRSKIILQNASDLNTALLGIGLSVQSSQSIIDGFSVSPALPLPSVASDSCAILSNVLVRRLGRQLIYTQIRLKGNLLETKQFKVTYWENARLITQQVRQVGSNVALFYMILQDRNAFKINKVIVEIYYTKNQACKDAVTILCGPSGVQFVATSASHMS